MAYYEKHPKQARVHPLYPDLVKSDGVSRLSIWRKAKILHNNLFGVDLDPQAVEITMMNLYLKALEQERGLPQKQHLLPELGRNIRCGNSLIAPDIQQEQKLSKEELRQLNPFDWHSRTDGFGDILQTGGFEVVIGNPPYGADFDAHVKSHLKKRFSSVADYESAQYFILRAAAWLRQLGLLGLIVPNTTFLNVLAKQFRSSILDSYRLEEIVDLSEVQVFQDAAVRTSLVFAKKVHSDAAHRKGSFIVCEGSPQPDTPNILIRNINIFARRRLFERDRNWFLITLPKEIIAIIEKVESRAVPLKQFTRVSQGLIPYDKYRGHSQATIKNRIWHARRRKNKSYRRELRGGDVSRYLVNWNGEQWIRYGPWLAAPRKPEFFTKPRLLFREITNPGEGYLNVAYTEEEFYNTPVIINVIGQQSPYDLRYFLGIANSKLIGFYHHHSSPKSRKGMFPKILVVDVRNLPIRPLDLTNSYEKDSHDGLVNLANQMLSLKKRLCRGKLARDLTAIQQQIDTVDQKIDALVYKIYGITAAECTLIETARGAPRSG